MARRINLSLRRDEALSVTRVSVGKSKELVYVLIADKPLKYTLGKSRIAYIGCTEKGIARIARTIGARAPKILATRGIRSFSVRIISLAKNDEVKGWRKLERAFLLSFKDQFGRVPECNQQGKAMKEKDEFETFSKKRISAILSELS